ncbi:hypothetical protein [Thermobrachium celere]|uniref:Uncharacterized protein n=1 Tax=Thermobrachium celere DSM 8682 TaxID=941824 RepID=R7RUC1_9CLOT|nr:hypothetical protein [Thermobrachium celere]GFR34933.1 hypothetical protein TCEA9_07450 [Thermobrachium celere]CDF58935.1 hypothetical protein TCEL_01154 [Thermobrachium celere DSM 8682]
MSDYRINFGSIIDQLDQRKLVDVLNVIGRDDELVITIEAADATQTENINRVLENNGFDITVKGGHDDNKYHIIARRRQ